MAELYYVDMWNLECPLQHVLDQTANCFWRKIFRWASLIKHLTHAASQPSSEVVNFISQLVKHMNLYLTDSRWPALHSTYQHLAWEDISTVQSFHIKFSASLSGTSCLPAWNPGGGCCIHKPHHRLADFLQWGPLAVAKINVTHQ